MMKNTLLKLTVVLACVLVICALSGDLLAQEEPIRTPGYWKVSKHLSEWQETGYDPLDSFGGVFHIKTIFNMKLIDVLHLGGGGTKALGRHAVAAILNASHPDVSYLYTAEEVKLMVSGVLGAGAYTLGSEEAIEEATEEVKDALEYANEMTGN